MAKAQQKKATGGLSDRTKKIAAISLGCVVLAGAGWWGYFRFTTVPAPELAKAAPVQVVEFFGDARGLARMPVDAREQYLVSTYRQFSQGEARQQFIQSMNRMSSSERQVFYDAVFDITHVRVVEMAKEYNSLPMAQRGAYVDQAIQKIEKMREELGGGSRENSVGEPLKADLPTSSDEMMKILVTRTSGQERADAKPFVDRMALRYKEMKNSRSSG